MLDLPSSLNRADKLALLALLEEKKYRREGNKLRDYRAYAKQQQCSRLVAAMSARLVWSSSQRHSTPSTLDYLCQLKPKTAAAVSLTPCGGHVGHRLAAVVLQPAKQLGAALSTAAISSTRRLPTAHALLL